MNCLEFRKQILAAPRSLTAAMIAHRGECTQCVAFAAGVDKLESALKEAVLVDPPEGLANRILLRRSLADALPAVVPARRRFLALAASVAVATTGLGAFLFWRRGEQEDGQEEGSDGGLARELVAHLLMKHPPGLGTATQLVSETEVTGLLKRASFASRTSLGRVENAWPCEFRYQPIAHLVLPGAAGPVTALVLPFAVAPRPHHFAGPNLSGVIAPCAHGTLALLAESDTDLDALAARLQRAIVSA